MKKLMLRLSAVAAMALASVSFNAAAQGTEGTLPLAEARAQIGDVATNPDAMTALVKQLSPEDQKAFLADVNAAIAKMPGSNEEKAARFLNANRAALKGATKGNLADMLAEVFATVPPEALTVINERFAADLFNRSADPSKKYSDEEFLYITTNMMAKIESRTEGSDDAGVRNAFAAMMFIRSSNGSPADLASTLAAGFPDKETQNLATSEWFPAALAETPNYDSILGYANAGEAPNAELTMLFAGPQMLDALLNDVTAGMLDSEGKTTTPILDQVFGGFSDPNSIPGIGGGEIPRTLDPTKPWNAELRRGELSRPVQPPADDEESNVRPIPYKWQRY